MELVTTIKQRKSIRTFKSTDVSDELLNELIKLSMKGSSAGGIRGCKAIITRQLNVYNAPVCVVICIDYAPYAKRYGARGVELYAIQDSAIIGAYLQLLLVDNGLASVWVGAFQKDRIKRVLETELEPVAIIALGYSTL